MRWHQRPSPTVRPPGNRPSAAPSRWAETLTADTSAIADDDGLVNATYTYQWVAGESDIGGATGSSYTLEADDEGKTIKVRVTVTDDAGNETTLSSGATDTVEAPQPPAKPTGLSAAAVSHDAVTLAWDNPQDDSITGYVILRRDREIHPVGTFVTITDDTGSADTTYTDDTVEPDKQIRVPHQGHQRTREGERDFRLGPGLHPGGSRPRRARRRINRGGGTAREAGGILGNEKSKHRCMDG